jgi:hypothetical protein
MAAHSEWYPARGTAARNLFRCFEQALQGSAVRLKRIIYLTRFVRVLYAEVAGVVLGEVEKVTPGLLAATVFIHPAYVALFDETYNAFGVFQPFLLVFDSGQCINHEIEIEPAIIVFWSASDQEHREFR